MMRLTPMTLALVASLPICGYAGKVELGLVGNDTAATNRWCDAQHHSLKHEAALPVAFTGRATTGQAESGKIQFLPSITGPPSFIWASGADPVATYLPEFSFLGTNSILVTVAAPLGKQTLSFAGLDDQNQQSSPQTCSVLVVSGSLVELHALLDTSNPGTPPTLTVTIRNRGTEAAKQVPWQVWVTRTQPVGEGPVRVLGSGVVPFIDAGQQNTFTVVCNVASGASYNLTVSIDPNNTLQEDPDRRLTLQLTMRMFPATLVTQDLDFAMALQAGAGFVSTPDGTPCAPLVGDWASDRTPWRSASERKSGVVFSVNCFGSLVGQATTEEAFQDFRLQNGWRVKSVDTPLLWQSARFRTSSGFTVEVLPVIGTDNPYMRLRLWADSGNAISVAVHVTIEGSSHADPYRNGPVTCAGGSTVVTTPEGDRCANAADVAACRGDACQFSSDCSLTGSKICAINPCGGVCVNSGVVPPPACTAPTQACGDFCVDQSNDNDHCGDCTTQCRNTPIGLFRCAAGRCVNTTTDSHNCGAVGTVCPTGRGLTGLCVVGRCR